MWDVIIKEPPVWNWHIPYLCGELQEVSRQVVARTPSPHDIIINIPPSTTKSTIATIMYPAWLWTQDPTLRIITNSYSADLAIELAVKSRDIIQSDKYKKLFPNIKIRRDKAAKTNYENTDGGARYSTSTAGTITGKHAHVVINDDPLNPAQAASDAERLHANAHTQTLASRAVSASNTPIITIMQRLHEDDVTGHLLSLGTPVRHICLPAEVSDQVKPVEVAKYYIDGFLDPVRLNREVLAKRKVQLGSRAYAGQYEQAPTPQGGNIIQQAWFRTIALDDYNRLSNKPAPVFFVDTAFTSNEDNDPTGIIATTAIGNNIYITNAATVHKAFPELVRFLQRWTFDNEYTNSSSIRIEPKANGLSIIDQLRESTQLNVTKTSVPKDNKITRLYAASPTIEAGRVILVKGAWNEEFITEVCGFPYRKHDEFVDVLGYAIDYYTKQTRNSDIEDLSSFLY
jgi:predicted phage terminase large subunit-like protein